MITKEDVLAVQKLWGDGIIAIGKKEKNANDFLTDMYVENALFKPTMAKEEPFRMTREKAISYFITGCCQEDNSFALKPWSEVRFTNHGIITHNNYALAMGHYFFKSNNEEVMVEYSFGYIKANGQLKINLHHSSLPYRN